MTTEYDRSAAAWERAWSQLDGWALQVDGWRRPWVDESWKDGNPIFSAHSPLLDRAVRVLTDPSGDEGVTAWENVFAAGTPDAVRELILTVPLGVHVPNLAEVRSVLDSWVRDGVLRQRRDVPVAPRALAAA